MNLLKKYFIILSRLMKGEDISVVRQSVDAWNSQYKRGRWDFLFSNVEEQGNVSFVSAICNRLGKDKKTRILDVGCGNGSVAMSLKDKIGGKIDYYGVDISDEALDRLKIKVGKAKLFCADAENPPNFKEKFDVIIFCEVFYYFDYLKVMKIYKEFLADDGYLIISMYDTLRNRYIWQRIKRRLNFVFDFEVINKKSGVKWRVVLAKYA